MATSGHIGDFPSLPFQGAEPLSRHNSYKGAQSALPRAGSQALRLLTLYREAGCVTDHEAAEALGLPLASICARRGWLKEKGFIVAMGSTMGPFNTQNTLWGLA